MSTEIQKSYKLTHFLYNHIVAKCDANKWLTGKRKKTTAVKYRDKLTGAVQVELDTDKNSRDRHGNDHREYHTEDHVFPSDTWPLPAFRWVATFLRL